MVGSHKTVGVLFFYDSIVCFIPGQRKISVYHIDGYGGRYRESLWHEYLLLLYYHVRVNFYHNMRKVY